MHRSKKLQLLIAGLLLFVVIAVIPLATLPDKLNPAYAMFNSRKTENDSHGNWVRGPHIMKTATPNRVLGHNQILNNFVTCSGSGNFGDETYDWPSAVGTTDKNTFSPRCWYNPTPSVHWSPTPASTLVAQGTPQQEIDETTFNSWQQAVTGMADDPGTLQQETDATTNSWQKALTNTVVDQGTSPQETDTTAVNSWPQIVLSIVIDHGTDVGAPHFDYYGRKRPKGKAYDIGPFEIA